MMSVGALTSVKAQDTVTMDLKACMRYAVEHSTKMRIAQADNRDAQIDRRDAILAAFTPTIEGSTYAYSNFGRSIDPETNTYIRTTSFHNGYSLSAGINLFNGFQAVNNLKITKTAQMMGLTKEQQTEDQICLATMEAYCNVLYYTEMQKALQAQVTTAEKAVQLATRQEQLGQKSHADVVQMQSDLAERQYQLTTCRNNLNNAMITLKDVMFWPIEKPLKIDDFAVGLSHCGSRTIESLTMRLPRCDSPTSKPSIFNGFSMGQNITSFKVMMALLRLFRQVVSWYWRSARSLCICTTSAWDFCPNCSCLMASCTDFSAVATCACKAFCISV